MAFFLTSDKLDHEAYERERDDVVKILLRHRETRWKDKEDWASVIRETGEVELQQFIIGLGKMELPEAAGKVRAELAPENVEGLFKEAQRRVGPGTDIHMAFWKEAEKRTDPLLAKLELYALSGDAAVLKEMNDYAETRFAVLGNAHRRRIRDDLKPKRRDAYRKLQQAGRDFTYLDWELPEQIVEKPGGESFEQHLYCDKAGKYQTRLNSWETRVLSLWMKRPDFVGWLRNPPSKERSFCVPYEHGGWKRAFPDLIVLRREGKCLAVDVLEPHRANEDDTFAKAKGLAEFAETHGNSFGRLMMLKVEGTGERAVVVGFDVNDPTTRKKALKLRSNEDVQGLFRAIVE
jgi:type III restriction enzyme